MLTPDQIAAGLLDEGGYEHVRKYDADGEALPDTKTRQLSKDGHTVYVKVVKRASSHPLVLHPDVGRTIDDLHLAGVEVAGAIFHSSSMTAYPVAAGDNEPSGIAVRVADAAALDRVIQALAEVQDESTASPRQGRTHMPISAFFERVLGAAFKNNRWSWGALDPDTNRVFLRVWDDDIDRDDRGDRVVVLRGDWRRSSSGLKERQTHIELLKSGAAGFGVLCTAASDERPRTIVHFDRDVILRFGALIEQGDAVLARIVDRVPVRELSLQNDLRRITPPDPASGTTRAALVDARLGQGRFRDQVLAMWDRRCCVTGSTTLEAIRASHIKPWRDSTDAERVDPANGLPLIATIDCLFDVGLITFDAEGGLLVASELGTEEAARLGLAGHGLVRAPHGRMEAFLRHHREAIFRGG